MAKHVHRWTNVQIQPLDQGELMERRERWCHTCDEYERVECLMAEGQALWAVALSLWYMEEYDRGIDWARTGAMVFASEWKASLLEGA